MVLDLVAIKRSYAERLRAARQERGMTQQDLAVELGVAIRSVTAWEDRGDGRLPDGENAIKIEQLLAVTLLDRGPHTPDDSPTPE